MSDLPDLSRRNLLRRDQSLPPRLPWLVSENAFIDACTRCGDCIDACPTGIIQKGRGGFVELNFDKDECTFCQACVKACKVEMFRGFEQAPWSYWAEVQDNCLTHRGVVCHSCKDACEPRAIAIRPTLGQVARPQLDLDACTGCGACKSVCPADAVKIQTKARPSVTSKAY
ncbi:ferredoxin-type protein NapF [Paraferrimonas sedimenticola]|uniref:Ferredoxin-type protein NapF n=1 Tax=Paraferrimonas sedimenticola TaxID=375674 RepID=A0AA37W1W3_9GAMM|nr:ferredoxin-type protein NapF [Paraferrimonas sedimenticola]GLP96942.1 ferredoxin-type protein NapF [Paraferrimonas sedimenticola]